MPIVFGVVGTALGMGPVFLTNGLLLAAGAWIMRGDVRARRVNS